MTTPNNAVERAQALLAERISVIEDATKTAAAVDQAKALLDEAQRTYADAWKSAMKAGWSRSELRKMGLPAPATTRHARTPRARTTSVPDQTEVPAGE